MNQTADQICQAARQCFFQYGYSKTTLTMVAEQAGVSRVTLYKYFSTKENLFRFMIWEFMQERVNESLEFVQKEADYWRRLEQFIHSWVVSPFEAIASDMVRDDLAYTARRTSEDYLDLWRNDLRKLLEMITQEAEESGTIDPAKAGLDCVVIARTIMIMITGLTDAGVAEVRQGVAVIIRFLKATLQTH